MKILLLSDLHLEFADLDISPPPDADVLVLAGDIANGDWGIQWAREWFPDGPIVYVAGNHEFYGWDRSATLTLLRKTAARHDVAFLDNDEAIINGVRFLGATLWTDFRLFGDHSVDSAMRYAAVGIRDFDVISEKGRRFAPEDTLLLHQESVGWLQDRLAEPHHVGPTVVVTHHAPSRGSLADRFAKDLLSAGFVSRLEHLMGVPSLWLHGHTHDCFDYLVEGSGDRSTRVVCNPRGYWNENFDFDAEKIIEI